MNKSIKSLVIAIFACAPLLSYATITQKGSAPSNIPKMTGYGVAVPIQSGLPSLVPSQWDIMVAEDVKLPPEINWEPSDTWVSALDKFSSKNNLMTTIDWSGKSVAIRNLTLKDTAITPIPVYDPAPADKASVAALTKPAATSTASTEVTPVIKKKHLAPKTKAEPIVVDTPKLEAKSSESVTVTRTVTPAPLNSVASKPVSPVVAPIATTPIPATSVKINGASAIKPAKESDFNYFDGKAVNQASVRSVAQGIANRFGLRLVYLANEEKLKGPVTVLGKSASEDVALLNKAMGLYSPVKVRVEGKDLLVFASENESMPSDQILAGYKRGGSESGAMASATGGPSKLRGLNNSIDIKPLPLIVLDIKSGDALEDILASFAKANGYTFEWIVPGGFEANHEYHFEGESVKDVLAPLLTSLNLSADIYKRDKHIVVRPSDLTSSR